VVAAALSGFLERRLSGIEKLRVGHRKQCSIDSGNMGRVTLGSIVNGSQVKISCEGKNDCLKSSQDVLSYFEVGLEVDAPREQVERLSRAVLHLIDLLRAEENQKLNDNDPFAKK
jgi:hypothetical protein